MPNGNTATQQNVAPTPGAAAQKIGTINTTQINLAGGIVQNVDQQVTHHTTTKYISPWFVLRISEKGKDLLDKALAKGDRKAVRDFIVAHMKLRFGKLEAGKEGELYQEGIIIFESLLWKQSLGIP